MILFQFSFRKEKEKVEAVGNYYVNTASANQKIVKFFVFVAKIGIPVLFAVFVSVYWTFGIMKYISG